MKQLKKKSIKLKKKKKTIKIKNVSTACKTKKAYLSFVLKVQNASTNFPNKIRLEKEKKANFADFRKAHICPVKVARKRIDCSKNCEI
jgi:hypothetical protein